MSASDLELEQAVKGFLERHPNLALERFHLPGERLTWLVPFHAVNATRMLLNRWASHEGGGRIVSYVFDHEGNVALATAPDRTIIPQATTEREIGAFLWESPRNTYLPIRPGSARRVSNEWAAFRRRYTDGHIDLIASRLIDWLFAALKEAPGLMYGFRAQVTERPTRLRLEMISMRGQPEEERDLAPWRQ